MHRSAAVDPRLPDLGEGLGAHLARERLAEFVGAVLNLLGVSASYLFQHLQVEAAGLCSAGNPSYGTARGMRSAQSRPQDSLRRSVDSYHHRHDLDRLGHFGVHASRVDIVRMGARGARGGRFCDADARRAVRPRIGTLDWRGYCSRHSRTDIRWVDRAIARPAPLGAPLARGRSNDLEGLFSRSLVDLQTPAVISI